MHPFGLLITTTLHEFLRKSPICHLLLASDATTLCVSSFADLPDEGPIISGGFPRYHVGDRVNVNCTSRRSRPAAKLKWYINGEQADPALVKKYRVSINLCRNIGFAKL